MLADEQGQILEAHSISAGLDYPGVGPEHAQLRDTGRARYVAVTDDEALRAFRELSPARGDHPRARARPRDRVAARREARRRPDGYDVLTLSRPRRQGHGRGAAQLAGTRWLRRTHRRREDRGRLRRGRGEGRAALMPYLMGGFPDQETCDGGRERLRRGGCGPDRARCSLLGPARRRPVIHAADTAALAAGARGRRARDLRGGRRPDSGRADGLREHGPARARASSPSCRRRRRRGRDRPRPAARGGRGIARAAATSAGCPGPPRRPDDPAERRRRDLRARPGVRLCGLDRSGSRASAKSCRLSLTELIAARARRASRSRSGSESPPPSRPRPSADRRRSDHRHETRSRRRRRRGSRRSSGRRHRLSARDSRSALRIGFRPCR